MCKVGRRSIEKAGQFFRRGEQLQKSQGTKPKTGPAVQAKLENVGLVLSLSGQAHVPIQRYIPRG